MNETEIVKRIDRMEQRIERIRSQAHNKDVVLKMLIELETDVKIFENLIKK